MRRIFFAVGVLLLSIGRVETKEEPPPPSFEELLAQHWRTVAASFEPCAKLATEKKVYGSAVVRFVIPAGSADVEVKTEYTDGLGVEITRCVDKAVAAATAGISRASDVKTRERVVPFSLLLGQAAPLFDSAQGTKVLTAWQKLLAMEPKERRTARAALGRLLPAELRVDARECIRSAGTWPMRDPARLWLAQVGSSVSSLWIGSHAVHQLLAPLIGSADVESAAWLPDGWILTLDYLSEGDKKRTPRVCLVQPDESQRKQLLAQTDDVATCWKGDLDARLTQPAVEFPQNQTYRSVSVATSHACALTDNGAIVCCGARDHDPPKGTFTGVDVAEGLACAIRDDDTITCWGADEDGGTSAPVGRFAEVVVSPSHGCARTVKGRVTCWGHEDDGIDLPPDVKMSALALDQHRPLACGLTDRKRIACWGKNSDKRPTGERRYRAVELTGRPCGIREDGTTDCGISPPKTKFTDVESTSEFACGMTAKGVVSCWRGDQCAESGADCAVPEPSSRFLQIDGASYAACGVRDDGSIECWGTMWPAVLLH